MSVYTSLSSEDLGLLLERFSIGELVSYKGIAAGIENTNYFVNTTAGSFVLTLFEHQQDTEVTDIVRLAHHLGKKGLNVPAPISGTNNTWLHIVKNKPAIICPKLAGEHIHNPQPSHCFAIGEALAHLHVSANDLTPHRPNNRDYDWWISAGPELTHALTADEKNLLQTELNFQTEQRDAWLALPHGWIHGDLFHDNALFVNDNTVGAILDLYNASYGAWLYDVAVVANDWCSNERGQWKEGCVEALLKGYETVRTLEANERAMWNVVLRAAALRFWLSRLLTKKQQQEQGGELALQKDPNEYCQKLRQRRA